MTSTGRLFFRQSRGFELAQCEGNATPRGRKIWWGALGRTLSAVLDHIAMRNNPRLMMLIPRLTLLEN
jgi:hypothetical protein